MRVDILKATQETTIDDVDKVENRIDELKRELEVLNQVSRILRSLFPAKYPKVSTKNSKPASALAVACHDVLATEGSMPLSELAKRVGKPETNVMACVRANEWFRQTPVGDWDIAIADVSKPRRKS